VQAVGELDQDDADVVDHRQEHLAQILGLGGLFTAGQAGLVGFAGPRDLTEFGDAVDQRRNPQAEFVRQFVERDPAILDHIVKQRSGNHVAVEAHSRKNDGNLDRVN